MAQCPIDGVQPVSGTDRYAQSDMDQSDLTLYRMDSKTMKLTQVLSLPKESSVEYLGSAGETDYLLVHDRKTETYSLCSVRGDTVKTELTLTEAQQQAAHTVYQSARGCISSARTRRPVISSRKQAWSRSTWRQASAN